MSNNLFEYLLVAPPDTCVYDKTMKEKEWFSDEFKEKVAVKTLPHITIGKFLAPEAMESILTRRIERICREQQSFIVALDNYSGFRPHTIYLRVRNEEPFQLLAKQLEALDDFIRASGCPPVILTRKPHLSIARRLSADVYYKAMEAYAQKTFQESFILNELQLLKREHQFDKCKTVQVFRFKPWDDNFSRVA